MSLSGDQHDLIDQIYYWNQVKPFDAVTMQLIKKPYDEILEDIEYQKRMIEMKHARMQADAGSVHSINTSVSGKSSIDTVVAPAQQQGGSGSFSQSPKTSMNAGGGAAAPADTTHNQSIFSTPSGKTSITK